MTLRIDITGLPPERVSFAASPLAELTSMLHVLAAPEHLTSPEVSRHLAVLRRAGLLTTQRHGRYVHYSVDLTTLTALGADLLAALLR